jgi:hypothetical protein
MAITLTYLDDLSRVRVQASGLAPGYVRVERSINGGLLWETVRGASALEVVGGAIQIDDYEFAPDIENTTGSCRRSTRCTTGPATTRPGASHGKCRPACDRL